MLYVLDDGTIHLGLVLTVWLTKTTAKKTDRKVCSAPCPLPDCYAFRVVELKPSSEADVGQIWTVFGPVRFLIPLKLYERLS